MSGPDQWVCETHDTWGFEDEPCELCVAEAAAAAVALAKRIADLEAGVEQLRKERDEARETVQRLNRRCQEYESGLAAKLDSPLAEGRTFGRVLANSAASMYLQQRDAALALLRECELVSHVRPREECDLEDCPGCRARALLEGTK